MQNKDILDQLDELKAKAEKGSWHNYDRVLFEKAVVNNYEILAARLRAAEKCCEAAYRIESIFTMWAFDQDTEQGEARMEQTAALKEWRAAREES